MRTLFRVHEDVITGSEAIGKMGKSGRKSSKRGEKEILVDLQRSKFYKSKMTGKESTSDPVVKKYHNLIIV